MRDFIQQFKIPIAIAVGFFVLGLMVRGGATPERLESQQLSGGGSQFSTVTYVVDGDTVEIDTGERVRLIGIDAAERDAPFYRESRDTLSRLVLNKKVRMEKDVSDKDYYNRLLRYLYVDDTFVNLEMVRQGYATVFMYPPDVTYTAQFLEAQQEARSKQLGLWALVVPSDL